MMRMMMRFRMMMMMAMMMMIMMVMMMMMMMMMMKKSEITILTICNFFLEAAMRRAGNNPTDVEVSDIVNRWD